MTILITGANGQLGTEMRLASAGSPNRYVFTDVNTLPGVETIFLDVTNIDAVRIICESENVDCIVNCAAYTNVDKAEDDSDFADLLNRGAAENLASVAAERNATLIHVSTDYVFDGSSSFPYQEDAQKCPLGVYGATKYAGELAIEKIGCKYMIFRTAWLYSPFGKNFVKTMMALTEQRPSLGVVFDQVGTPTYAADLAALIVKVIEENLLDRQGIYHYTDEGVASWYDFTKAIARICGNECDIRPLRSDEYPSRARRPHYSVLDKSKVKAAFGIEIPYWLDSLEKCIKRLK